MTNHYRLSERNALWFSTLNSKIPASSTRITWFMPVPSVPRYRKQNRKLWKYNKDLKCLFKTILFYSANLVLFTKTFVPKKNFCSHVKKLFQATTFVHLSLAIYSKLLLFITATMAATNNISKGACNFQPASSAAKSLGASTSLFNFSCIKLSCLFFFFPTIDTLSFRRCKDGTAPGSEVKWI